jgi:hypothetical protein
MNRETTLATVGEGEVVGEVGVTKRGVRKATVVLTG